MTDFSALVMGLLLLAVSLLGVTTFRLIAKVRRQKFALDQTTEDFRVIKQEAEQHVQSLAQRSHLDLARDEFVSNVSHELRTPLTSIRGALGLLSAGLLGTVDAKAHNLLRIASSNTERLIRLINDILDLERMDAGHAPLNLRRCSLYELAHEAVDTMTALADGAQVHLELTCLAPRKSIYFDGDSDRILQVITNLLSNAIKFSPPCSTVCAEIDADSDSIILKVVDHGRGIPSDKLESVFDRFQQIESTDASKKGGSGLGLAICRNIVHQHGGAIWARRNLTGSGTTLWVQFTRSARASDPVAPALVATPSPPGEGLILVCDDDPGIRMVIAEQLRQHGYDVLEARSGEEVVSVATLHAKRSSEPAISAVLLDLCMPGLSGWDTVQQLRKNSVTAALPIVIVSAIFSTDAPTQQLMREGHAQGWVQKPFNENMLIAEIGRVLEVAGRRYANARSNSVPASVS